MIDRFELFTTYIADIHRQIQKIERDEMVKYGVRGAYAQYLAAMSRHPEGVTSAQLCEICERDKAAISRAVADMEASGLVERRGATDSNYRALIRLTEEGQKLADIVFQRAQTAVEIAGHGLSDDERAVFYHALELIAANLQGICRDGIPGDREGENKA